MKVNVKTEEVDFKPVTVSMTFETAEELQVFHRMCRMNVSIPDIVFRFDNEKAETCEKQLSALVDALDNAELN